jgi:RNA polymerase sigma factor (sigma-70 family)
MEEKSRGDCVKRPLHTAQQTLCRAAGLDCAGHARNPSFMLNTLTTTFVRRLRDRDEAAWFELWETFGPVLRAQLAKWGKGRIGVETVRDLTQETLAALSDSIDRYDPSRGARFSTWLLSIAKHALGDEMDRRQALKRGSGKKPTELDERFMSQAATVEADDIYQQNVFFAKVYAAIRKTESESDFMQFQEALERNGRAVFVHAGGGVGSRACRPGRG